VNEELKRKIDEGSKIPVWEDSDLEDMIELRLDEIRKEAGREDDPQEVLERIQIKVTSKVNWCMKFQCLPTTQSLWKKS